MRQFATDLFKNGNEGDVLKKNSDASMDFGFGEGGGGGSLPEGGKAGDILVSDGEGGAEWQTPDPQLKVLHNENDTIICAVSKTPLTTSKDLRFELSYEVDPLDDKKRIVTVKATNDGESAFTDTVEAAIKCTSIFNESQWNISSADAGSGNECISVYDVLRNYVPLEGFVPFALDSTAESIEGIPAGGSIEETIVITLINAAGSFDLDTDTLYNVQTVGFLS